ncbi:MAG TPA: ATP-grasp domain-containing protein [Thermoleophilaceae bacterium]|nr:ATP-grasp domain-containing protein [Thermoleophilaceae bacterium]
MTFLFLDPGADAGRRDVYRVAQSLGMGVTLVALRDPDDPTGVDERIEANPTDPVEVLAATAHLDEVEGVVNCSESCLRTQAALVEHYGVPGIDSATAAVCRDKQLMMRRFEQHGVPIGRRRVVSKLADIPDAVRAVGCPGVLKPSTGVASLFTVRFDSEDELDRWFAQFDAAASGHHSAAIREMDGRWLVEEYLDGPAFSVESVTLGGETTHVAVCKKGEMSQPFFLETGHTCPAPIDRGLTEEMKDVAGRAIAALGIRDAVTHSELKLTSRGIRVLEVGARMGGGSIRQVVKLATGVDLLELTLELARAQVPEIAPLAGGGAAASRSWFPDRPCVVRDISRAEELLDLPGIVAVNRWTKAGDVYRLPPEGYREVLGVVAVGDTPEQATARAEAAVAEAARGEVVAVDYDPNAVAAARPGDADPADAASVAAPQPGQAVAARGAVTAEGAAA